MKPILRALLRQWDVAMTPLVADPQTYVDHPGAAARARLAALFTADSPYIRDFTLFLKQGYVGQDVGTRAVGAGPVQHTTLTRVTDSADADHINFVFCSFNDGLDYTLSTGRNRKPGVGVTQGEGSATRTSAGWRLDQLHQLGFVTKPAGAKDPCPDLASQ